MKAFSYIYIKGQGFLEGGQTKSSYSLCVIWSDKLKMMQDFTWGESTRVIHVDCEILKLLEVSQHRRPQQERILITYLAMTRTKQLLSRGAVISQASALFLHTQTHT